MLNRFVLVFLIGFYLKQSFVVFAMNSMIGTSFKEQQGKTLSQKNIVLPQYFNNRITLVAFGFSRKCQDDFDSWIRPFKIRYNAEPQVFFMEIPMIGHYAKISRSFIDGGMRKGIDKSLHDHVMSFYGKTNPYKQYYGFSKKKMGYFILLDSTSTIVWQAEGRANVQSLEALYRVVDEALDSL